MNKTELIAQVAEKTGLSKKDSELAINVCCILFVLLMLLRKEPEKPKET